MIFRQEAIDGARARISVPDRILGLRSSHLAGYVLAVLSAAILFAVIVKVPRRELAVGELVSSSGLQTLVALREGVVEKLYVREGQFVKRGDRIAKIVTDAVDGNGRRLAEAAHESATTELNIAQHQAASDMFDYEQKERAVRHQIAETRYALRRQESLRRNQEIAVDLARQDFDAVSHIAQSGFASKLQQRKFQTQLLQLQSQLDETDMERGKLKSGLEQSIAELSQNHSMIMQAKLKFEEAKRRFREKKSSIMFDRTSTILASRDGVVSEIDINDGEHVSAGELIALVSSGQDRHSEAVLWLPTRAAGMVVPGAQVNVSIDAFPAEKFGIVHGTVVRTTSAALSPEVLPTFLQSKEKMFKLHVRLSSSKLTADGRDHSFLPGMQIKADIVLENRTILQWIFKSVIAAKSRFNS